MNEVKPEVAAIITRKKLRYCRYADTHQWHLFDSVALPHCTFEYRSHGKILVNAGFTYSWNSTQEFVDFFSKAFENLQTIHIISPGEFEQVGPDEIKAVFTIVYYSSLKDNANESHGVQGTGGGHYYETYRRQGDDWFLESLIMERVYEKSGQKLSKAVCSLSHYPIPLSSLCVSNWGKRITSDVTSEYDVLRP